MEYSRSNGVAQIPSTQRHVKVPLDLNKSHPPLPQGPSDVRLAAPESQSSTHGARHERWCTTREHKSVFKTYRGFAKHENEHDNYYIFLPQGPIENTSWGPQCALCEATNPSKAHLREHNTLKYDGWIGKPITRSRRGNFEELLRKHKTSEEKIKVLLNKWRKDPEKKAYACGFCIRLFRTLPDRTSHIDREHYAKGEHIKDWNDTLVIKGLLLQQDLMQECLRLFHPVDPTSVESKISWPPSVIEDLQLRLELRQEMAKDLARDVFDQETTARLSSLRRRHKLSDSYSHTESGKCIETSTLTQEPTKFDRNFATHTIQLPIQDSNSLQGPHAQRQAYTYDQNNMGILHTPVLSLPTHQQLSVTNSALPILSVGSAPNSSGNADFIYGMSNDPFGAEGSTSETPHDLLASPDSPYVGVNESDSLDDPYFVRMSPDSDPNSLSFDASASEIIPHTSSQLDMCLDDTNQNSFQSSRPKRKLSDKSAKEANLKAQTQNPVSKYNQGYPGHNSGLEGATHKPRRNGAQAAKRHMVACIRQD